MKEYKPEDESIKILDFAYSILEPLPYKVSLRSLFYALLQKGYYHGKEDYRKWKELCIKARKRLYKEWRPWTFEDDTRGRITRTGGHKDIESSLKGLPDKATESIELDHFYQQERYVEIWFESRGMASQFRYYTEEIDLVPLGGDPSLPLMWDTAKMLEWAKEKYDKDILILYFGDCDFHGNRIMKSTEDTIREWCDVDFDIKWCALTKEQAEKYMLPEKFDKSGEYQWESFGAMGTRGHKIAGKIIESNVSTFVDVSIIEETKKKVAEEQNKWQNIISDVIETMVVEES